MDFTGKVVLITGASSGIGASSAIEFAKFGANLALVGRNVDNLKATAERCKEAAKANIKVLEFCADVTSESNVTRLMAEVISNFNRLDVLVNAAGIIENGSIENTNLEQYDRLMNVNVRSVYQLTMLATPELLKTKGNIVNISSVCGLRAFPNILAYAVSKAAIDQFTRCVALELAPKGVRCNVVNPGVIVTELHKRGGMTEDAYEKFLEHCKTTHALGRAGEVDEVSNVICFLASNLASFITGASIPVDGGRHAMCPR